MQLEKRKILIVDDNEEVLAGIRAAFEARRSYELHEARTGLEGLVRAKQIRPDIILLDYMLPGMDGAVVLRHLRSEQDLSECKVIVLTAMHSKEDVDLFANLGVDGYLVKPFLLKDLIERVEALLRNHNSNSGPFKSE